MATAVGLAQEDRDQGQAAKADLPGPVHQRLNELAGTWDVVVQYMLGDKQHEGKATCEAKWILDGRFLQQEYNSQFQGKPFHVVQLLGYDNPRKKTIEIMMDNLSTGVLHNEGSISEDGKVITNTGESLDPVTGKPYKLRTVTTIVDHDHFTLEWFRSRRRGQGKQSREHVSHTKEVLAFPLQQHDQPVSQRRAKPGDRTQKPERPDEPFQDREPPPGMIEQARRRGGRLPRRRPSSRERRCPGSDGAFLAGRHERARGRP